MPWRLIQFIVIFAIFLAFIAFNLENRCDISFGFRIFSSVPVFLTVLSSFIFGMLCAMPFIISVRKKRKDKDGTAAKPKKETAPGPEGNSFSDGGPYGIN